MSEFIQAVFSSSSPLLFYALLAGVISSFPCGIIGTFVTVRRISYIAGAISHAALAGIGAALYLSNVFHLTWLSPLLGALVSASLSGIIIPLVSTFFKERQDTAINTVWALGMGIGLVLLYWTPVYVDPMKYLFGNLLLVGRAELSLIVTVALITVGLGIVFYNQLLAISFDSEFSRIRGLKTSIYEIILIMLISFCVVLMVSIIGILLVITLLTIPASSAGLFSRKLWQMMILSAGICILITVTGLYFSFILDAPPGAAISIIAGLVYFLLVAMKFIIHRLRGGKRTQTSEAASRSC